MKIPEIKKSFLSIIFLFLVACATGYSIVTGKVRTPTDATKVKLYLKAPKKYAIIGIVQASSGMGWTEQDSVNYAIEELKNQASKLGANGILLKTTNGQNIAFVGNDGTAYSANKQIVYGQAIYDFEKTEF